MKTNIHFDHISLREMFQTKVEEGIKTHISCSTFSFSKIVPFMR